MSAFYNGMQDTATNLLTQFGKPMTIRIPSSVFDPSTQQNVVTYTDYPVTGVLLNYQGTTNESGTYIQSADKKIITSAGDAPEPGTDALVLDGTDSYQVVSVLPSNPAGVPLVYTMQGRL